MFTGIITDIGTVESVAPHAQGVKLVVATEQDLSDVALGASIACSGACMTVTEKTNNTFSVDVSPESLRVTHIDTWEKGTKVNLERALKMGDELGGHIVTGHVDGVASIVRITSEGENYKVTLNAPDELKAFIAKKGSVTLDGISLTVNSVEGAAFTVNIIPHTWQNTTLAEKKEGDVLHLEIDTLARYTARLMEVENS